MFLYSLLRIELEKAEPETKLFLIRAIGVYAASGLIQDTEKQIALRVGLTDRVVNASLKYLVREGYLTQEVIRNGRGRPRASYRFASDKLDSLAKGNAINLPSVHAELLQDVLSPDRAGVQRRIGLRASSCLLMAVLLVYADSCGVVRNVGRSMLKRLTGMSSDRLASQLQTLKKRNFLLAYSAGETGSAVFGAVAGRYFLNLWEPGRLPERPWWENSQTARAYAIQEGNIDWATRIYKARARLRILGPGSRVEADDILQETVSFRLKNACAGGMRHLLAGNASSREKRLLQSKLEDYACLLLARNWEHLGKDEYVFDRRVLRKIRKEICPKGYLSIRRLSTVRQRTQMAYLFYNVSWLMAEAIQSFSRSNGGEAIRRSHRYALLPMPVGHPHRLVVIAPDVVPPT